MWLLTDNDTQQYVQAIEDGRTYRLIDTIPYGSSYAVIMDVIVLDSYIHNPTFVETYLHPYCYHSYDELCEIYGNAAPQIAAECIFETDSLSSGTILFEGSAAACHRFITHYVQKEDKSCNP